MKSKNSIANLKGVLMVMLSSFLFFKKSEMQSHYSNQCDQIEFTESFGVRSNEISSNYISIDKIALLEVRGSAGLVW